MFLILNRSKQRDKNTLKLAVLERTYVMVFIVNWSVCQVVLIAELYCIHVHFVRALLGFDNI